MRMAPLNLRFLYRFVGKRVTNLLALGVATGLILFAVEFAFAYILQAFFVALGLASAEIVRLPAWVPQSSLTTVVSALLAIGVLRGLLYWAQQFLPQAVLDESAYYQRSRILHWAFQSDTVSSAQVITLFNEINNGAAFALMAAQNLIVGVTTAALLGGTLLYLSTQITLLVAAILLFLIVPLRWMDQRLSKSGQALWDEWAATYTTLFSGIKNLLLMRIYGTQDSEEAKARASIHRYRENALRHYGLAGLKFALPQIFGVIAICVIALSAKHLHSVHPGLLISYFYILIRFVQSLALCAQHTSGLITYRAPFLQLAQWWMDQEQNRASQIALAPTTPLADFGAAQTPIGWELNRVAYRYPEAISPTFASLDLNIEPGKAFVILGPSGAGKSTLLNLILGGLAPTEGRIDITVNGVTRSLRDARTSILPSIGYVGPESFLIEGTLRKNLLYGLATPPTDDEINEAIELSGCQFIRQLPKGLDHFVSEQGTGLSAGQKQRLSLARALLRKPRALILDEATSNLDVETELKLVQTLGRLKGQMTIVAVTHRQPLLEIADGQLTL